MACPQCASCTFYRLIEPSVVKRVRYASSYAYCRGGQHETCALYPKVAAGAPVPPNLLPDGTLGQYLDEDRVVIHQFLIIEDMHMFAVLASNTLTSHFPGAQIVCRTDFAGAEADLNDSMFSAVICGFGLGDGRTVHDVRALTEAPIVVLTGRVGELDAPSNSRVVQKGAGPEALVAALRELLDHQLGGATRGSTATPGMAPA